MILGITGGTGSGKTTLLKQVEALGGVVLDCDKIYHQLLQTDEQMLSAMEARFPGTVENGVLDRKKLGSIVFADANALQELNRITHAAVKREVLKHLEGAGELVAIDAIGLFEGELAQLCDVTVAVIAPEEDRIRRLMARDSISEEYARSRIAAQHNDSWYQKKCDHCLENDQAEKEFQKKCLAFLQGLGIMKKTKEKENSL